MSEKNNEDLKRDTSEKIKFDKKIILMIIIVLLLPIIIEKLIFQDLITYKTFLEDEIWFSFWASYIGAIGTISLGIIALKQNKVLSMANQDLHNIQKDYFDTISKPTFRLSKVTHFKYERVVSIDENIKDNIKTKFPIVYTQKEDILLELQKKELLGPLTDTISEEYLKKIFENHKQELGKRHMEMIKNFIKLYVQEVVVYNDYVEVVFTISQYLVEEVYGEACNE